MRRHRALMALLGLLALPLAACGGDDGDDRSISAPQDEGVCADAEEGSLLAEVCEAGKITVSTDPAYPPQSSLDKKTGDYVGFDIDVATEIADRLGLDAAWEAPSWDVITAGSWNDRWQMSVGSMTPTNDRQEVLLFTEPYYYTPAVAVVPADDDSISDLTTDLDGKTIAVCAGCTYEQFLEKKLKIQGFEFDFVVDDATVVGYDTDTTALQDLVNGRADAAMTSLTTAQGFIDAGNDVKIVGDPLFYEPLAVAIDKSSEADPESFYEAVNQAVEDMHEDGTLTEFSEKWYDGTDLSVQQ